MSDNPPDFRLSGDVDACEFEVLFNDGGGIFLNCRTHGTLKWKKEKIGDHEIETPEGSRLQRVCRNRLRLAFKKAFDVNPARPSEEREP